MMFFIIRRLSKMKDVDVIRYTDPHIKKCLVTVFIMRANDVRQRPFAYNFDLFLKLL